MAFMIICNDFGDFIRFSLNKMKSNPNFSVRLHFKVGKWDFFGGFHLLFSAFDLSQKNWKALTIRGFFVLVSTFPFPRKAIIMIIKYPSDETFQKWPKCKKVPWAIFAHFPQTVEWLLNIFSIFGSFFQSWRDPHRYGRPSWGLRHRCPF